jgi:hypothetical protein
METRGMGARRYRRRDFTACDGRGAGRGRGPGGGRGARASRDDTSLATRTAMRAVIAAGTYVAQDVRDRDGLTRPMLRRTALRMVLSRQTALRRLGAAYLRADPPAPEELPAGASRAAPLPSAKAHDGQVIDVDPLTVSEADAAEDGSGV